RPRAGRRAARRGGSDRRPKRPRGTPGQEAARTASPPTRVRPRTRRGFWRSGIPTRQLIVEPPLERRIESSARGFTLPRAGPPPGAEPDHYRSGEDPPNRQPPGQQAEALVRRGRQDRRTVLRDESTLDLA